MNKHTQEMLQRLTTLLIQHSPVGEQADRADNDAQALRRISMTLHRWHELECGDSNSFQSWVITRGDWAKVDPRRAPRQPDGSRWPKEFVHDENGRAFMECHSHNTNGATYNLIPDRERGAQKRLAKIMARYPTLAAYVQGDPRGAALYILKASDIPEGASIDSCYSNGVAVYK